MTELRDRLLAAFQVEHLEHLNAIRAFLAGAEHGDDAGTTGGLDEAFRCAHSLKAAARVCDFHAVEAIAQRLEALFSRMRKERFRLSQSATGAIHQALNSIAEWAARFKDDRGLPEPVEVLAELDRALTNASPASPTPALPAPPSELKSKLLAAFRIEQKEHLEAIRSILSEIERRGSAAPGQVDEAFRRAHSLKGAARVAERRSTEALAHQLESLFAVIREGTLDLGSEVVRTAGRALDAIEDNADLPLETAIPPELTSALKSAGPTTDQSLADAAASANQASSAEMVEAPSTPISSLETVRVSAGDLDRLLRSTGQIVTESMQQNAVIKDLADLGRAIDAVEREWATLRNDVAAALPRQAASAKVDRALQELGAIEQHLRQVARQARAVRLLHQRAAWTLRTLSGQLRHDVQRVRMVAAETVFHGFRKMMRDLAREEGKQIEFRVAGLELAADRMVLQALKDPLMHVLRNAISHGLETPDERLRRGKGPVGRVDLRLEIVGNRLNVRVEDDGRGIDFTSVSAAASERGLLSEPEAAAAGREELVRLLFRPGFSTARSVTGLSGRGMGLSVVFEAVSRLQGDVEIRPRPEAGTVLVLSAPVSVSAQRLLLVSCRGQKLAIPLHSIERLLRVTMQELDTVAGRPTILIDGQPVPALSLAALLDMMPDEIQAEGGRLPLVILRSGAKRVAAIVDSFVEERDSLIHQLDRPVSHLSHLAGGILLEDGTVCLVLNVAELIRNFKPSDSALKLKPASAAPKVKRRSTVLVVDDSLTTRTLEKSILEAHGYDVRIAVDGVEALAQLRLETVDLVITDIQMPRMDGLQLLEEMKKDSRLGQIPVIVVTSMGRREDQERGLALGADAYIVKRKFDHEELLETIRQII